MMSVAAPPIIKLTNYINGRWTDSRASEWRDVINPATGEILAQVPLAEAAEVNQAVEAAAAAFPARAAVTQSQRRRLHGPSAGAGVCIGGLTCRIRGLGGRAEATREREAGRRREHQSCEVFHD